MKLTKYAHACFIVEEQGKKLLVDPGAFTTLPDELSNIVALIITHDHTDHFSQGNIDRVKAASPEVKMFAAREVVAKLPGSEEPAKSHQYVVGPFNLQFYGELHATVRPEIPHITNLGVCINDIVAYPGDSYVQIGKHVKVILAPANAPWTAVDASYAFVFNAQADITIPTHDGLLSEAGQQVYDGHLRQAAEQAGSQYRRLSPGESLEI